MARPSSTLRGNSVNTDGILPHAGAKSSGPVGGTTDLVHIGKDDESLNVFEKAWLYMSDSDYYGKHKGSEPIDTVIAQVYANNLKYGTFYGFVPREQEEIYRRLFKSTRGAIPLADIVATIATLPFGGGLGVGLKIAVRLGFSGVVKTIFAHFVDSLGSEITAVSIDILADKKIDYKERAKSIAAGLAVGSLGAGLKDKLSPLLEKKFLALASKNTVSIITAQNAVDAKIIDEWTGSVVDAAMGLVLKN